MRRKLLRALSAAYSRIVGANNNKGCLEAIFVPDWRIENPYLFRLSEALEKEKCSVTLAHYSSAIFPITRILLQHPKSNIVHFHWLLPWINPLLRETSEAKYLVRLAMYVSDLLIASMLRARFFWTVHNLVEHESSNIEREIHIRRLLSRFVSGIFFHSYSAISVAEEKYGRTLAYKAMVTRHATYVDDYPGNPHRTHALSAKLGLADTDFVYLFFGLIRDYKGVEQLVAAFSKLNGKQYRLIIAGKLFDTTHPSILSQWQACDSRIILHLGFVPNADVRPLFSLSTVLVLPYTATLSSGLLSLGLTFGTPMILPEHARVYDEPGDRGAVYFSDGQLDRALMEITTRDLAAMRAFNQRRGESLTWNAMAKRTVAAYRKTE